MPKLNVSHSTMVRARKTRDNRPWLFPQEPWSRLHLDYAGPIENRMILVAVDSFSQRISAMVVRSSTSNVTIEQLRMLFAEHGLPETIVTDNATCFTSV